MEEQEKFDIINRRMASVPDNWVWRSDRRKFGWGSQRKNKRRKNALNFIQNIKRKIIKGLCLTDEEVTKSKWYSQLKELMDTKYPFK